MQKNLPDIKWNVFDTLPSLNQAQSLGYAGPVTGIHNDMLFIAGGANFPESMPWLGGKKKYYNDVFVTDVNESGSSFQQFKMPINMAYSANCSSPLGVVTIGGENETGVLNTAFLIRWIDEQPNYTLLPLLPKPITNATATCIGDEVYVAGGEDPQTVFADFYKLNLNDTAAGWQKLADVPHAVSNAVTLASNDGENIYLFGGRKKNIGDISTFYNNVYEYNVHDNKWVELASMPYALSAGTGSFINDGMVALYGGDKGIVYHETEKLINAINAEKDSIKKEQLINKKTKLQSEHPGFSKALLFYNVKMNTWTIGADLPYVSPVTTTAIKNKDKVFIPSGEIKAGVRSPLILEGTIQ